MARYVTRRLIAAAVLVAVVSSGALLLTRLAPGDFASELFGGATAESMAAERARYGLDRPIGGQYLDWLGRAARFDFGVSLVYHRPVAELVGQRALNTSILALAALIVATLVGLPAGIVTGSRRRGLLQIAHHRAVGFLTIHVGGVRAEEGSQDDTAAERLRRPDGELEILPGIGAGNADALIPDAGQ